MQNNILQLLAWSTKWWWVSLRLASRFFILCDVYPFIHSHSVHSSLDAHSRYFKKDLWHLNRTSSWKPFMSSTPWSFWKPRKNSGIICQTSASKLVSYTSHLLSGRALLLPHPICEGSNGSIHTDGPWADGALPGIQFTWPGPSLRQPGNPSLSPSAGKATSLSHQLPTLSLGQLPVDTHGTWCASPSDMVLNTMF